MQTLHQLHHRCALMTVCCLWYRLTLNTDAERGAICQTVQGVPCPLCFALNDVNITSAYARFCGTLTLDCGVLKSERDLGCVTLGQGDTAALSPYDAHHVFISTLHRFW